MKKKKLLLGLHCKPWQSQTFVSLSLNQALFNRLYLIGIFAGIPQELRNIFWQGLAIK